MPWTQDWSSDVDLLFLLALLVGLFVVCAYVARCAQERRSVFVILDSRLPRRVFSKLKRLLGRDHQPDNELLNECFELVRDVEGDYVEFGVFKGQTFLKIISQAQKHGKTAYAFDSFRGLAAPGEIDKDPSDNYVYPEGKFDVGGPARFEALLRKNGFDNFEIIEGFIPDTLRDDMNAKFCFAHIDLDHYGPTVQATRWCFDRLSSGGVIAFDDYFSGRAYLATPAIEEFIEGHKDQIVVGPVKGRKIYIQKQRTASSAAISSSND